MSCLVFFWVSLLEWRQFNAKRLCIGEVQGMNEDKIRVGNTQSAFDTENSNMFTFQFFVLAVLAGVLQSDGQIPFIPSSWDPWVVGGVTFVFTIVLMVIPVIKNILAIGLTLGWGFFGYSLMKFFDASVGATWTVAIMLCLAGAGLNSSGMRWAEDVN